MYFPIDLLLASVFLESVIEKTANHLDVGYIMVFGYEWMRKGRGFCGVDGKHNYTYIVECADGTLYTGWTTCIERRISQHNSGKGAKYTKSRGPVRLRYLEEFGTRSEAMRREAEIKRMSRAQKEGLIRGCKGTYIIK